MGMFDVVGKTRVYYFSHNKSAYGETICCGIFANSPGFPQSSDLSSVLLKTFSYTVTSEHLGFQF